MVGFEVDMIVGDSLKALALYEGIFDDIERIEVTDLPKGENEVVFSLYGSRIHMLDGNESFGLLAPSPDIHQTIWFNIMVEDIKKAYNAAMEKGCSEIQGVREIPDYGVSNAIFSDPFGYQWMLHQMHKEVSFEERVKKWEERK
ncbi:MAG TPA: MerR family transcriptional regulator [Eubacteriaceae bacterium]|nr:MerR family transcriptional regulator [Eubacteriaceae bacterium]